MRFSQLNLTVTKLFKLEFKQERFLPCIQGIWRLTPLQLQHHPQANGIVQENVGTLKGSVTNTESVEHGVQHPMARVSQCLHGLSIRSVSYTHERTPRCREAEGREFVSGPSTSHTFGWASVIGNGPSKRELFTQHQRGSISVRLWIRTWNIVSVKARNYKPSAS